MRRKRTRIGCIGSATCLLLASLFFAVPGSAGPTLPPAPYKPIPVGTLLDYGSWRCEVEAVDGMDITCRSGDKRIKIFAGFVLHGAVDDSAIGGYVRHLPGHPNGSRINFYALDKASRNRIAGIWPLTVGKSARGRVRFEGTTNTGGRNYVRSLDLELKVVDTGNIDLLGRSFETYLVHLRGEFGENLVARWAYWYAPELGAVVKWKFAWIDGRYKGFDSHSYTLIRFVTPDISDRTVARHRERPDEARPRPSSNSAASTSRTPIEMPPRRPAARPQNRDGIAVIIGNKNYKGQTPPVDFAHNDAAAMKEFVIEQLGYRPGNVIDLRDATGAEIRATFGDARYHKGRLFNWVREGKSDVVVFYSGHGVPGLRDKRGYLLPVDGEANLAELTGYPLDTLLSNLEKIPGRSMTVIIDACFSGNTPKGMVVNAVSGLRVTPRTSRTESITLITAAQGDQVASWDEKVKHGLFTSHVLAALRGQADREGYGNGDGKVTLGEIKKYLEDEMTYQARRRYNRDQNPTIQGPLDRVLATYPRDERREN